MLINDLLTMMFRELSTFRQQRGMVFCNASSAIKPGTMNTKRPVLGQQ